MHSDVTNSDSYLSLSLEVIKLQKEYSSMDVYQSTKDQKIYLTLLYPFNLDDMSYLKVTKDITPTKILLDKILHYIFIINIAGFVLVILYAITLSKMLVTPVQTLSMRLSKDRKSVV